MEEPLCIGVLAASRIASTAVLGPAREVPGIEVTAIGARDLSRAQSMAAQWRISRSHGSYEALLADDELDAIYISTPVTMHREWTIAALEAGRHVLCEKPLAANADDAQLMADAASRRPELVAMEAFHWRYHPLATQIQSLIAAGRIGVPLRARSEFSLPAGLIGDDDIRWDFELGGGALMDLGCYSIQWARFVAPACAPQCLAAEAEIRNENVDASMRARLRWEGGFEAEVIASMAADGVRITLEVEGTEGAMTVINPLAPQNGAKIFMRGGRVEETIEVAISSTYVHQLEAFRDAIASGGSARWRADPMKAAASPSGEAGRAIPGPDVNGDLSAVAPGVGLPSTFDDGVLNMAIIDDCYRRAGMTPRIPTP